MVNVEWEDGKQKFADAVGIEPVDISAEREMGYRITPVASEEKTPERTLQTNRAEMVRDSNYISPRERRFVPISLEFSDPIKIAPRDRKQEQERQKLAQKGLAQVDKEFEYGRRSIQAPVKKRIQPNDVFMSKPVGTGYDGDWYVVEPEEITGRFGPREYKELPKNYQELTAECEKAKQDYEAIDQKMDEYAQEHNYLNYMRNPGYGALAAEHFRAWQRYSDLKQAKEFRGIVQEYLDKKYDDNFYGQLAANFDVGQLTTMVNDAYSDYLKNPTPENKVYAGWMEDALKQYQEQNAAVLDDQNAVLPWISKTTAGYLPQLGHQLESGVKGSLAVGSTAAAIGTLVPGVGTMSGFAWGAPKGYIIGVGNYSYDQMSGAAYRRLIELGVDEETAHAASKDEALVSALIEMADAGVDIATLGTAKIASPVVKKILYLLGNYGINVLGESFEEGLQQTISVTNDERITSREYDPDNNFWERGIDLASDSAEMFVDAFTGNNPEAREQIFDSMDEGAKIALLFGGSAMVGKGLFDNRQETTVQSSVERGIMSEGEYSPYADLKLIGQDEVDTLDMRALFYGDENSTTQIVETLPEADLWEPMDQDELADFDPWALFVESEKNAMGDSSISGGDEEAALLEQSFLSGLQDDSESGSISDAQQDADADLEKIALTAQENLALFGETILDNGGMPEADQLNAMGMDEPTARGIQSLVWLSKEGDPEAQRTVETMVDLTVPEAQLEQRGDGGAPAVSAEESYTETENDNPDGTAIADAGDLVDWGDEIFDELSDPIISDGSHMENGRPKPNVVYQTGEHDYRYQTNERGLIVRVVAKVLKLKEHIARLEYNSNTYGKEPGDHAGHLIADWFGGSPELDNLVSQAGRVNCVEFLKLEHKWAAALRKKQEVSVHIDLEYMDGEVRPNSFVIRYKIGEHRFTKTIRNE